MRGKITVENSVRLLFPPFLDSSAYISDRINFHVSGEQSVDDWFVTAFDCHCQNTVTFLKEPKKPFNKLLWFKEEQLDCDGPCSVC